MNQIGKKIFSLLIFCIILGMLMVLPVSAKAEYTHIFDLNTGNEYVSMTIPGTFYISGTSDSKDIHVDGDITVSITLKDVSISLASGCAFQISGGAKVNLKLEGTNSFTSGTGYAGIYVSSDSELSIFSDSIDNSLIVKGGDSSDKSSGSAAGIGGNGDTYYCDVTGGGKVTINGGTIIATGGSASGSYSGTGAGIGGGGGGNGDGGAGGTVTINGGSVTATGGACGGDTMCTGAGIGGGGSCPSSGYGTGGEGGIVTINGGKVTATGGTNGDHDSASGAGIGGGGANFRGGLSSIFTIKGGTVMATGGRTGDNNRKGNDIGPGGGSSLYKHAKCYVSIYGGSINAEFGDTPVNGTKFPYSIELLYKTKVTLSPAVSVKTDVVYVIDDGSPVPCCTDAGGNLYLWLPVSSSTRILVRNASNTYYLAGSQVITAAGQTVTANKLTSMEHVTGVSLNETEIYLKSGATYTLSANILPADPTDKSIIWSSSNTSVATVSSTGVVSPVEEGVADITATTTDGAKTAVCVVTVDYTKPSGNLMTSNFQYISSQNLTSSTFTICRGEAGTTCNYTFSGSDNKNTVTGAVAITNETQKIPISDLSGLSDGELTFKVAFMDKAGNVGEIHTHTIIKDTVPPKGYQVLVDGLYLNSSYTQTFSIFGVEKEAAGFYTISNADDSYIIYRDVYSTLTQGIPLHDASPLPDGRITLRVTLRDKFYNWGLPVTVTFTKDTKPPEGYDAGFDQSVINSVYEDKASITIINIRENVICDYVITDGEKSVAGENSLRLGFQQITGINLSILNDGKLTLRLTLTDVAGNTGLRVEKSVIKKATASGGYLAIIDQKVVNSVNKTAASISFTGGEAGATYQYSISDGKKLVTGTGVVTGYEVQKIEGIDLSGLSDGTITLRFTQVDTANNIGKTVTNTVIKDTKAPSGYSVTIGQQIINSGNMKEGSFTFTGAEIGASYRYEVSDGTVNISGAGTVTSENQQIKGINLSGLRDGDLALSFVLTDTAGNAGENVSATVVKDTSAPSGYSVSFEQTGINSSNAAATSLKFSGAETGASYSYSISDGKVNISGAGIVASNSQEIKGIDLRGLSDGPLLLEFMLTDLAGNEGTKVKTTIIKDIESPAVSLVSPAGTGVPVSGEYIELSFSETVTAVPGGTITISDGKNNYIYAITSGHNYVSGSGSGCKAVIPVSSFVKGTAALLFEGSKTYTLAISSGAYMDGVGNVNTANASLGNFTTAVYITPDAGTGSSSGIVSPAPTQTPALTQIPTPIPTQMPDANRSPIAKSPSTIAATEAIIVSEEQISTAVKKAVEKAAEQKEQGAAVQIKVDTKEASTGISVSLPKNAVNLLVRNNISELTFQSQVVTVTFMDDALSTLSKASGENIKLIASKTDEAALSQEVKQVVGDRPVFNFSVISDNMTISQFGGNITVSVPYTPKTGEDTDAIVIYYINAAGKPEIISNCIYDAGTEKITFKTSHFSQYGIGYNKINFTDVAENVHYAKAVNFVAARGISLGNGKGKYSPQGKLTRGQFLVMVMKAYGIKPEEKPKDNFSDAGNAYYTGYLAAAKRLGISAGVGGNKYAPEKEITRQEMLTLLYNILKQVKELPKDKSKKVLSDLNDSGTIASWAKEAVTFFAKAGLINAGDGRLSPLDTVNRAEMAQVLYDLLQ